MSKRQFLVLIRHGQSEANLNLAKSAADSLYYSVSGSDPAVGLTSTGRCEVELAAQTLRERFKNTHFQFVVHSNFKRVEDSVDILQNGLGYALKRIMDPRVSKRNYGRFWNLTRKGVEILFPEEFARYQREGDLLFRPPDGGENYHDVFARVCDFLKDPNLVPNGESCIVVTHSVVCLSARRTLEGLPDQEVVHQYESGTLSNGQILVYFREKPGESWRPDNE